MSFFSYARCPQCCDKDRLDVAATVWMRLTKDGTDADEGDIHDHEFTPKSLTRCGACGHSGRLSTFAC